MNVVDLKFKCLHVPFQMREYVDSIGKTRCAHDVKAEFFRFLDRLSLGQGMVDSNEFIESTKQSVFIALAQDKPNPITYDEQSSFDNAPFFSKPNGRVWFRLCRDCVPCIRIPMGIARTMARHLGGRQFRLAP